MYRAAGNRREVGPRVLVAPSVGGEQRVQRVEHGGDVHIVRQVRAGAAPSCAAVAPVHAHVVGRLDAVRVPAAADLEAGGLRRIQPWADAAGAAIRLCVIAVGETVILMTPAVFPD